MSLSEREIKNIFLTDDILPLGQFETIPVTCTIDGESESYPNVSLIYTNIDYKSLLDESYEHIKIVGFNYVKPRLSAINKEIDENTLRNVLSHVGFCKGSYQSYSLRKVGTNELEDWVLPNTRKFFNSLPVNTFRQQYAVAALGWNTRLHRDHKDFKTHGFRAMVPLSADVYMGYEDSNGNNIVYKLLRGNMYFVNIAKMHRGFNESTSTDRINLIMQMDSDILIDQKEILPLSNLEDLPDYASKYEIWEFGYEL